jgi:hypothetical protein
MSLEVVDPDEWLVVDPRQRLREVQPDEERSGEARAVCHRDRVDVVDRDVRVAERFVEDGDDPAEVGPRGDLGDDPAGRGVERASGSRRRSTGSRAAADHRDPGLVAGRLDGEDHRLLERRAARGHRSRPASGDGARRRPASSAGRLRLERAGRCGAVVQGDPQPLDRPGRRGRRADRSS